MTVEEIYDFISRQKQGDALHLDSSALGEQAKRAIDTYFDNKALDLGAVTITKTGNQVVARGVSSHRPFNALGVSATFFDSGGSLAATLAADLNGNWSFGQAFPVLDASFLGRATASDGVLTLATPTRDASAEMTGALSAAYRKDTGLVPLGRGFFRANGKGGYLAGFAAPDRFTPASLWSALEPLFSILEFSDSGIIYSTIEAKRSDFGSLDRTSVPETIKPGVTFFTSLRLGGVLNVLSFIFGSSNTLNLRGQIDVANPANSTIQASIPGAIDLVAVRFENLTLNLRPGQTQFDLLAKAVLSFGSGKGVTLDGGGTVSRTSARMQIIIAEWKDALGIPHFNVSNFGLAIGAETGGTTAEFLGNFKIGAGKKFGFRLGGKLVNFAKPSALVFELDKPDPNDPLKLSDIIEAFTSLDLSSVPLIGDIAFRDLAFYAIADPSGKWTAPVTKPGDAPATFNNGLGIRADLRFFGWDMKGALEAGEKGIKAEGSIAQGINILGVLKIHAYGDTSKGPSFKIDTSKLIPKGAAPSPRLLAADDAYFAFDGAIDLLGITQQFKGSARDDGFNVDFSSSLAGLFTTEFHAAYKKGESFSGSAKGAFDLRMSLPALKIAGVTVLPAISIDGPTASLAIGVAVSKTEAKLDLRLQFSWLGASFDIGFTLDAVKIANLLGNLWEEIKSWILSNLEEFYGPILETAQKFIDAVKKGAIWVADQAKELANILKNYFNCAAEEVSKFLTDVGCAFEDAAKAIADAFTVAYEEAARIVKDAVDACGMGVARGFIGQ